MQNENVALRITWVAVERLGLLDEVLDYMISKGYNRSILVYAACEELGHSDKVRKEFDHQLNKTMTAMTVGMTEILAGLPIAAAGLFSLWFLLIPLILTWHGWHLANKKGPKKIKRHYNTVVLPKIASKVGSPEMLAAFWVR